MAWITEITSKVKENDCLNLRVKFTEGPKTFEKEYLVDFFNPNIEWLKRQISLEIKKLQDITSFEQMVSLGVIDSTQAPEPAPTAAEIARQEYGKNILKFNRMRRAIDMGVKTSTDTDVVTLKDKLKADYKPEYLDLF